MNAIMAWRFPIWYFFECCSEWVKVYFLLRCFFEYFKLFSHVVDPFGFSVMFPYFSAKLFFPCLPVFGLSSCILSLLAGRIFYRLWRQIKIKRSPNEQPFKSVWELVHLDIVITKRGVYFSARVKTGWSGTWPLVEYVLVQSPFSGI